MSLRFCFDKAYKADPSKIHIPVVGPGVFRLIMPFTLSSGLSLFNFTGGLVKRLVDIETITRGAVYLPASIDIVMMNAVGAVEGYDPIVYKAESLRRIFAVSSVVWVIAAAGALIAVCLLYSFTC